MVDGPKDFPIGKEYWEQQAQNGGVKFEPKITPKKTIKVPIVQHGEAIKIEQPVADSEIVKPTTSNMNKILAKVPAEVRKTLKTEEDVLKYIKAHQHDFGVSGKPEVPMDYTSQIEGDVRVFYKKPKDKGEDAWKRMEDGEMTPELYKSYFGTEMPQEEVETEPEVPMDYTSQIEGDVKVFYKKPKDKGEDAWKRMEDGEMTPELYKSYFGTVMPNES